MKRKTNLTRKGYLSPATVAMCIFLTVYVASLLFMYIWGFITSLKTVNQFKANMLGFPKGAPWDWEWKNYVTAYQNFQSHDIIGDNGLPYRIGFIGMFKNSMIFSLGPPIVSIMTTWSMAYICSQFKHIKAAGIITQANLVLMLIPIIGTGPAGLKMWKDLNLFDTWAQPFIGSIGFIGGNFIIFHAVLRGVATEIREAAVIDGAGNLTIMIKIIFPMTINMVSILYVMAFIGGWNNYMAMVIMLPSKPSLAYGMYRFQFLTGTNLTWPPVQVAACMILMAPILLLFIILKDKIMGGLTISISK